MAGQGNMQFYPLRFDKGANTTDEATILVPGECSVLENWEPANLALRPRAGWRKGGGTATAPSSRQVRGISADLYVAGARKILTAVKDGTDIKLYVATGTTPDAITAWTLVKTNAITAPFTATPICFAAGNGKIVYGNPGFPSTAQLRSWDGASEAAVGVNNTAGRALVYHLNRFWSGGMTADPTLLRFSSLGDETSWNVTENYVPVGQDDGEPIEDICVFDRGLVIGKNHSLWWLSGLTPDSFGLYPLAHQNVSVAQGRSLVATDRGVYVVGRNGAVYLWTGGTPKQINTRFPLPVQASGYVTTAWINDRLYIQQSGGADTAVYEPAADRWWAETHVAPTTEGPQELAVIEDFLVAGTVNASVNDLLQHRREIGPLTVGTTRTPIPDQGQGSAYVATARPEFPKAGLGKSVIRELRVRYRQFYGDAAGEGFTVVGHTDKGATSPAVYGKKAAAGIYWETHTFGRDGHDAYFEFTASPSSSESDTYAIEEALVGVQVPEGRQ